MEKKILEAAVQDRHAAETIQNLVAGSELSDYARELLNTIYEYYSSDPDADLVDNELMEAILSEKYPNNSGPLIDLLQSLGETSTGNVIQEIRSLKKKELSRELASVLLTDPDAETARDLWQRFTDLDAAAATVTPCTETLEESLLDLADNSRAIRLYPNALNDRLVNGARHGNHIVLFARPGVGKTALVINLMRGLLRDGRKVAYFINEEPSQQVVKRLVGRITGLTGREIDADVSAAIAKSSDLLQNLYVKDLHPGTFRDVYGLTKEVKPDVVILDQLRNISTGEDNRVIALERAAQAARNLGKELQVLVISVTQAGDSASNKLVLDDGDIDYSNTGIPGACDLIVGMGCNSDYRSRGRRMLTIVKNKMGTDHSSFPVVIDEALSKIISI
mgnify:CR=1 FL=1